MKLAILTSAEMPNLLPYDMDVIELLKIKGVESTIIVWDEIIKTRPTELQKYDAILIRTIWDYFLKYDEYLELLNLLEASNVPVFNPIEILRWNANKKYLSELQNEGFDIIPTIFNLNSDKDSFATAISKGWKKMVLKPVISGNSYHTFVVDSDDETKFNQLIDKHYIDRPFMLQEFIPEISNGEISTIYFSNGYSYSVTKVPPVGEYRVQFDYGGVYHFGDVDPTIKKICDRIASRFETKLLYQRVDGVWRDGKFLIMEVELIEPDIYLNLSNQAKNQWVDSLANMLNMD
ncbi:MAG: hypothetical protein QM503_02390 [Bacteroidota bacterium]